MWRGGEGRTIERERKVDWVEGIISEINRGGLMGVDSVERSCRCIYIMSWLIAQILLSLGGPVGTPFLL